MKSLYAALAAAAISSMLFSNANAAQVITFDNLQSGDIAVNQYSGVVFTGASVLTAGTSLNPPYPPETPPNVVFNFADGTISLAFSVSGVNSVGAFVTGNGNVTEEIFNGSTLLGTTSTGGSNYTGSGGTPNLFLNLTGADITSALFFNDTGSSNTFTLDNVTVGGANVIGTVPLPASLPMFGGGLLALAGYAMYKTRVNATRERNSAVA